MSGGVYGGGTYLFLSFVIWFVYGHKKCKVKSYLPYIEILDSLDEVGALVFDPGSHSFRIGFAGEEFPKVWLFYQICCTLSLRFEIFLKIY